jgi:hypothetical protein
MLYAMYTSRCAKKNRYTDRYMWRLWFQPAGSGAAHTTRAICECPDVRFYEFFRTEAERNHEGSVEHFDWIERKGDVSGLRLSVVDKPSRRDTLDGQGWVLGRLNESLFISGIDSDSGPNETVGCSVAF